MELDLKRIQTLDSLTPQTQTPKTNANEIAGAFRETLDRVSGQLGELKTSPGQAASLAPAVKFSNHAIERMQSRGINYSPEDITKLNSAVQKAAAKGAKDSLVLMNDSALIVSVKNNTVVTVMDKSALKENVFTNIDSTVVI